MKLLVLTTRLFDVPTSGGEICTARLLDGLREAGHEVVLAGRGDAAAAAPWAHATVSLGDAEPPFDEQAPLRRLLSVVSSIAAGEPITVHRHGGKRLGDWLDPQLAACDAVIVDHLQVWPGIGARHARPVMLVNHNVESDNYACRCLAADRDRASVRSSARSSACPSDCPSVCPSVRPATRFLMRREAAGLLSLELEALERAAVVACLSHGDARRLQELAALAKRPVRARLCVLEGYPRASARAAVPPRRAGAPPTIGLIGTWTWAPNRQGLRWFVERVWPAIGGRARLVIAGNGLQGMAVPPGTQLLGRVADAGAFYAAVDVVAIASLGGSGVQEKAIEAIATGLPVVASPHAVRGLGDALPPNVRVAAAAPAFAAACLAPGEPSGSPGAEASCREAVALWSALRRARYAAVLSQCLRQLEPARRRGAAAAAPAIAGASG